MARQAQTLIMTDRGLGIGDTFSISRFRHRSPGRAEARAPRRRACVPPGRSCPPLAAPARSASRSQASWPISPIGQPSRCHTRRRAARTTALGAVANRAASSTTSGPAPRQFRRLQQLAGALLLGLAGGARLLGQSRQHLDHARVIGRGQVRQ